MSSINQVVSQIDQSRLWERHERLAEIGATSRGGVNRQALSKEEILARKQLREWGSVIGLVPYSDAIGNFFLRYPGENGDLAPVVTGSHIDTQPTGGRFDGSFGVLAALEIIEAMHATGYRPHRSVELVAWTNEEGSRFAPGMMGSAVFRGQRELDAMLPRRYLRFRSASFFCLHTNTTSNNIVYFFGTFSRISEPHQDYFQIKLWENFTTHFDQTE